MNGRKVMVTGRERSGKAVERDAKRASEQGTKGKGYEMQR